jgi:hypothetical protein
VKPFIAWAKKNWLIVVFVAVIVISLPTAWFLSSGWNSSIQSAQEKAGQDELKKVQATKVAYSLPQYEPSGQPVTKSAEPTDALTNWFKTQKDELAAKAALVADRAENFNKGVGEEARAVGRSEHKPLIEGIFPGDGVSESEMGDRLFEMENVLLAKSGRPNLYEQLLAEIGAGSPPDPAILAQSLKDLESREREKITANKRELTDEEKNSLMANLRERRLGIYRARAQELNVYADMSIFNRNDRLPGAGVIPSAVQMSLIASESKGQQLTKHFLWQWDYWVMSDVLKAVKLANSFDGRTRFVPHAVVKRIESIVVMDPEGIYAPELDGMGNPPPAPPAATIPGLAPLDKNLSVTGRGMGKWNPVYDVRRVKLVVIASSENFPALMDAITRTNFMTVTDFDLEAVQESAEFAFGYDYGGEHVVRASLEIETVWLRSWLSKYMPRTLRALLEIPGANDGTNPDGASAEAPAPAAPAPAEQTAVPSTQEGSRSNTRRR